MRVSQKADYAMRAMLDLALKHDLNASTRSADIARSQQIPEKFLELILVELRRAGLIASQRGPVGGHRLARAPHEISCGQIWRAIDGDLAEQNSASKNGRVDPFQTVWEEVDQAISNVVDHVTLADIRKRAEARQSVPDFSI